jgi:DNA-binding transcriptional MerR regulator
VKFSDAFHDIHKRWKESSIARRTERGLRAYRASGRVVFPRLYGYRRTAVGIEVVESEAAIIRLVLEMLAKGKSVEEIKQLLDGRNLRGRSGNLFQERDIGLMPKPAYCGMVETPSGKWVRSKYPAIVNLQLLRQARQRLSEDVDSPSWMTLTGYS